MMLNNLNRVFFPSIYEIPRTGIAVKCQIHINTPNIRSCQAVTSPHRPWNWLQGTNSVQVSQASELLDHHDRLVNQPKLMHDISWANLSIITHTNNHYGYKGLAQTVPKSNMLFPLSFETGTENTCCFCVSISSFLDFLAESNSIFLTCLSGALDSDGSVVAFSCQKCLIITRHDIYVARTIVLFTVMDY